MSKKDKLQKKILFYRATQKKVWFISDHIMNGVVCPKLLDEEFLTAMHAFWADLTTDEMRQFFINNNIDVDGTIFRIDLIEKAIENDIISRVLHDGSDRPAYRLPIDAKSEDWLDTSRRA